MIQNDSERFKMIHQDKNLKNQIFMKILGLQICKIVYTNYKKGQRIARDRILLSNHYIPIRKKRMRETTTKSFSPPSENHQKRLLCVFSGTLCHVVAFTIQV